MEIVITDDMIEAGLEALEDSHIAEFKGDPYHRDALIQIFSQMIKRSEGRHGGFEVQGENF